MKKVLIMNTNFYKWWKNNRRVLTLGGFLILLGFFLSPVIIESKYKNKCIKLSEKGALNKFNVDNIGEKLFKTCLTIAELAK